MKKLLTAAALAATVLTASAADVVTAADLISANPGVKLSEATNTTYDGDYPSANKNYDLSYTAPSGVKYDLQDVFVTDSYIYFPWNSNCSSNVHAMNKEMWVESVEVTFTHNFTDSFMVYGDTSEFNYMGRNDAAFQYNKNTSSTAKKITVKVSVPCHFIMIGLSQGCVESVTVNWTSEEPVPTCQEPTIDCYAKPVESGSIVYLDTDEGFTINAKVYVNDELALQPSPWTKNYSWESMSITLPGKAGDSVRVEAYTSKEGWVNSPVTEWSYESLSEGPCPSPKITKVGSDDTHLSYVIPGEQLQISVNTIDAEGNSVPLEGATVKYYYSIEDWDNYENNFTSETFEVEAPVVITVPETAPAGAGSFNIFATSKAEGYRESSMTRSYLSIVSSKLNPPTFSLEDGAVVKSGGSLTINRPQYASEIHYAINDGDIEVSTEYSVTIPVTEEMTVEAWATGVAPFEPSEKVTVTVAPEKIEKWQDVLYYGTFGLTNDDTDSSLKTYHSDITSVTGVSYEYYGGFWSRQVDGEWVNMFYFNTNDYTLFPYLVNVNPAVGEADVLAPVKTVQIDSYQNRGFYVFLSDTPITSIDTTWTGYDYVGNDPVRLIVANEGDTGSSYEGYLGLKPGTMINLDDVQDAYGTADKTYNDKLYFAIAPVQASQSYYMERAIVGYDSNIVTGVQAVSADALNGVDAIFNLNGVKVNSENLTPGIYVRVSNGKSTKVIVK